MQISLKDKTNLRVGEGGQRRPARMASGSGAPGSAGSQVGPGAAAVHCMGLVAGGGGQGGADSECTSAGWPAAVP
jgi:hypothetical protein